MPAEINPKPESKLTIFGPADQPFKTDNSILAFALYMAQASFFDDSQPCVNWYTIGQLRAHYKGVKPQAAAIQAVKDGRKGTVDYMFRQPDDRLLRAFQDEITLIEKSDQLACDRVKEIMEAYASKGRDYGETLMRLMAVVVYMRAEFLSMWQQLEPLIQLDVPASKKETKLPDGTRIVESSGFKFIGAYAGEETRKRMEA